MQEEKEGGGRNKDAAGVQFRLTPRGWQDVRPFHFLPDELIILYDRVNVVFIFNKLR